MDYEVPQFSTLEFFPKKNSYCLCIPVINEGDKIRQELNKLRSLGVMDSVDVIICDGGSQDGSLDVEFLKGCGVSVLLTKEDAGKLGAQLRMGYYFSLLQRNYEGIVTVDGNNKDSVADVLNFIQFLDQGYDFVQGSRFLPGGAAINTPRLRHWAVKLLHIPLISLAAGFKYTDTTNGFRAYSRTFLLDERVAPFRNVFSGYELLAYLSARAPQLGFATIEIPVTRAYPKEGKIPTKISKFKGSADLLTILFKNLFGFYRPQKVTLKK
ncbi:MAG: glycosyltransferase family 2 protein [Gammaproteobacteria bacterium]|nr:glycosyltransferase family 2 protein [Gammaproteobacteria bacterium]